MTTLAQVDADFDRLFGDAWQPTMPAKPEPLGVEHPATRSGKALPVPRMPTPEFPPHGGHEL